MNNRNKFLKRTGQTILVGSVGVVTRSYIFAQNNHLPYSFYLPQLSYYQPKQITGKSLILPASLVTAGVLRMPGDLFIADPEIKEERDENVKTFHTRIDDYLQFAPTAVGILRVLNNRHWASDVVAGAGVGILSTKLSELIIEPNGKMHHSFYNTHL